MSLLSVLLLSVGLGLLFPPQTGERASDCQSSESCFQNPVKHKYPVQRSAFTYCENEQPTRLDYGKSKYGGPFTTEQVDDVKTTQ